MFDWLWTGAGWGETNEAGIGALIDHEFNMYLHHQAQRNLSPNCVWLRTMVHSLTQQIVRGDLTYYAVYVCMRPDLNRRLVSYPYYAKFATLGDTTAFRHIDLNVPKYLKTGKGGNIIQGSVSFDNETERNCTEIFPGFHQVIGRWWADVKTGDRTISKAMEHDRPIHGLEKFWLPEHAKTYGDFMPVPCQRGDARITLPTIPHGSTPKNLTSQERRRTLLPWYVAVDEADERLDNEESDS